MITVDPRHWLNENGSLPEAPRLRTQMLRVAQCIEYGGPLPRRHTRETLIACRRRRDRKPCPGLLWVVKEDNDAIHAFCGVCERGEYMIFHWQDTDWADGPMEPVDLAAMERDRDKEPSTPRAHAAHEPHDSLRRALQAIGCTLTVEQVRRLMQENAHPTPVLRAILSAGRGVPDKAALERLMPILMETWNTTPRPDLGGRSPTEMAGTTRAASRPTPTSAPQAGRNDPCPCGSGRKYKKCCLRNAPN